KVDFSEIISKGPLAKDVLQKYDVDLNWAENFERKWLDADPDIISNRAVERGKDQLGTLGGGNHFIEMETSEIEEPELAKYFGISEGVVIVSHCGSRGFGHQIASEFFQTLEREFRSAGKPFPGNDRELVYCLRESETGDRYWRSIGCAANFAIVNH